MQQPDYKFYATLLDSFMDYQESDVIWEKYWGWSENPPHTPEEFHELQFQELINRINRVPYDSEAADKGTAFNEVVDCLIEHRNSDKVSIEKVYQVNVQGDVSGDPDERWAEVEQTDIVKGVNATYNNRTFYFDINILKEFAKYYKGAMTQQYVEAILPTSFGNVLVYGFIDELMHTSVHDIKTTSKYSVGKYRRNSQHLVYPYCLIQSGNDVKKFEYNVAELGKYNYATFTETYVFNPERDIPILKKRCEDFIVFINEHKDLITDKKIFNYEEQESCEPYRCRR